MSRIGTGLNNEKLCGKSLGKRIKEVRLEKGISVQKLADGAGVQRGFINQLENGDRVPSFCTLIKIINTLGVSADEILYDYVKNPSPNVINDRIARKLEFASETQIRRIEAHIVLELSLSDDDV